MILLYLILREEKKLYKIVGFPVKNNLMVSIVIDTEELADISTSVCLQICTVGINFSSLLAILYLSLAIYFL